MAYRISRTRVTPKDNELYAYFLKNAELSVNLYNAALFRIRQNFTGRNKDIPTPNEQQVLDEIALTCNTYESLSKPKSVISYYFMTKLMTVTENPDYQSGLPAHIAQETVKAAVNDFKNWLKSLKRYKKDPSGYLGCPRMPHYIKSCKTRTMTSSNQECYLFNDDKGFTFLHLPKTKCVLRMGSVPDGTKLKEVTVKYLYGCFEVFCVLESEDDNAISHGSASAGIDFGVDNTAALVSSNGLAMLYKGGALKSANQWFNKRMAELKSTAMQGHGPAEAAKLGLLHTKQMSMLSQKRSDFMRDTMHKISSDIIMQCVENGIGTLVLGVTKFWKQETDMGYANNQNFVQIPFAQLRDMIIYKAQNAGITVVQQEESYTSQASLTDGDFMPVYGSSDDKAVFSGRRVKRGLYRSASGMVINADLNGAGNILRKYDNSAFAGVTDWTFLTDIKVRNYPDFNKRIPVKGIAAA